MENLGKPNKNNRIYPKEVIDREIEKWKKNFINENRAFVCKPQECASGFVSICDIVGLVKEMEIINNSLMVEVEKLKVNGAEKIWELFEAGKLTLQPRGLGSVKRNDDGTYTIQNDYELISIDFCLKD